MKARDDGPATLAERSAGRVLRGLRSLVNAGSRPAALSYYASSTITLIRIITGSHVLIIMRGRSFELLSPPWRGGIIPAILATHLSSQRLVYPVLLVSSRLQPSLAGRIRTSISAGYSRLL